jgi:hypothetical protein
MSNDTALSIILVLLLAMTFITGALMGSLRRDTEWRRHLAREQSIADQRSADEDNHWETTPRDSIWN